MPPTIHKYCSEPINCEQIINSAPFRGRLHYFDSLDSTNTWLQKNGECGDICISNTQTAGRGRRGNPWISPNTGNIYFSLMWCFDSPLQQIEHFSLLGLTVGIAIAEALEEIGLHGHGVKWPNDIYWQKKKMGGILIENVRPSNNVIIGIGLNVNMPDDESNKIDQYITSLSKALKYQENTKKNDTTRDQLIISMIQHLTNHLTKFPSLSFNNFQKDWNKWDILKDSVVSFEHQNKQITGTVTGLNQQGQLGLLEPSKQLTFYSSADIRLSKPL